jgi:hypothetical protein
MRRDYLTTKQKRRRLPSTATGATIKGLAQTSLCVLSQALDF